MERNISRDKNVTSFNAHCKRSSETTLTCEICNEIFNNRYDSLVHNATHIIIPLMKIRTYECQECEHPCISEEQLQKHKTSHDPDRYIEQSGNISQTRKDVKRSIENLSKLDKNDCKILVWPNNLIDIDKPVEQLNTICQMQNKDTKAWNNVNDAHKIMAKMNSYVQQSDTEPSSSHEAHKGSSNNIQLQKDMGSWNKLISSGFSDIDVKCLENESVEYILPDDFLDVGGLLVVRNDAECDLMNIDLNSYEDLVKPKCCICKYCGWAFNNRFSLIKHLPTHIRFRNDFPPLCLYCDKYIIGKYETHFKEYHKNILFSKEFVEKCKYCQFPYANYLKHICNDKNVANISVKTCGPPSEVIDNNVVEKFDSQMSNNIVKRKRGQPKKQKRVSPMGNNNNGKGTNRNNVPIRHSRTRKEIDYNEEITNCDLWSSVDEDVIPLSVVKCQLSDNKQSGVKRKRGRPKHSALYKEFMKVTNENVLKRQSFSFKRNGNVLKRFMLKRKLLSLDKSDSQMSNEHIISDSTGEKSDVGTQLAMNYMLKDKLDFLSNETRCIIKEEHGRSNGYDEANNKLKEKKTPKCNVLDSRLSLKLCDICCEFVLKYKSNKKYSKYHRMGTMSKVGKRHKCQQCGKMVFTLNIVRRNHVCVRSRDKLHFEFTSSREKRRTVSNEERLKNIKARLKSINKHGFDCYLNRSKD